MDDKVKQRLVGAAVLVALAVIFIPMVLEGPTDEPGSLGSGFPDAPDIGYSRDLEPLTLPEPVAPPRAESLAEPEDIAPSEAPASTTASAPQAPAMPAPEQKPAPAPTATPSRALLDTSLQGWVVQVGSFSQQDNADRLTERLRADGLAAFVSPGPGGDTYRVRVGPELTRSAAESLQERLKKAHKLDGLVTQHP